MCRWHNGLRCGVVHYCGLMSCLTQGTVLSCCICIYHRTALLSFTVLWGCSMSPFNEALRFDQVSLLPCFSCFTSHVNPKSCSWKPGVCQILLDHALIASSPMHRPWLWNGKTHINADRNFPEESYRGIFQLSMPASSKQCF